MANETSVMLRGTKDMLRIGIERFDHDWDRITNRMKHT